MKFHSAGGVTLHFDYHHVAGAPLMVFINSLGTDLRIWDAVVARFVNEFSILCYDKRGHGLSGLGTPPYSIDDHVDDIASLLDFVGGNDVVICGLSVGGQVAHHLYARCPESVRALILCDTAHKIGTRTMWNARIASVEKNGIASIASSVLEKWFTPVFCAERSAELQGFRAMLTRQPPEGYTGTCVTLRDADNTALVARIAVPTLCLVGDQDGATPPDLVKTMADLIPGARFEIIPDAGHIPCVEQPDILVSRIKNFLASNGLGAASYGSGKNDRYAEGMATRRAVLGSEHVDRAEAAQTNFDTPFQELITEAAWGHVWSRPNWSRRERSMVTIALLAALGHYDEVVMHVRAAVNTGATREDIREAILHVAIYAGVPAANHSIKLIKQVYTEIDRMAGT